MGKVRSLTLGGVDEKSTLQFFPDSVPVDRDAGVAQIGTSTMTGRVTDSTDAIVPGASITVVQTGTNFTFNTNTNTDGLYRVLSLNPGMYRITAEAQGFKKSIRDQVELRTGDTLAVDFALQVGNVSESVEVTGVASLLRNGNFCNRNSDERHGAI